MLKKLLHKLKENKFIKASGIIFTVNMSVAVFNYLLIIFVSNYLGKELSTWTALTGIFTIFSSAIIALNLDISKKT
jgi:O-antigen/teichoic acid export membrane protein